MENKKRLRDRIERVYTTLSPLWPDAVPLLHYRDCFELLCAVVLSAQCTDEQVNRVTPELFARWPGAKALSCAKQGELEDCIHSVGFFRTKARHLIDAAKLMEELHGGRVPASMDLLLGLPGVGRKTANLVLSACFGEPGIIVDTHVLRVMKRLGFGESRDPGAMEGLIASLLPQERWTAFSHAVNRHGKNVCAARKPGCRIQDAEVTCPLLDFCPQVGLDRGSG